MRSREERAAARRAARERLRLETAAERAVLGYLLPVSGRNRLVRWLRRLRNPLYLLAAAAAATYLGWLLWKMTGDRTGGGEMFRLPPWAADLLPLTAAVFAVVWWVAGEYHRALAFTPAEADLLFTAPVPRRVLLQYKLLKAQPGIFFTTLFLAAGLPVVTLPLALRFVSLWVLVTTAHFHQIAASLVRTSALRQGRAGLRHQALPLAWFAALAGVVAGTAWGAVPAMRAAPTIPEALEALARALEQPLPALALLPFDLALAPLVARDAGAWAEFFPGAGALLLLHYLWLRRTDAAFEEAAAEAGARQAALLQAHREGRGWGVAAGRRPSRPWLPLAPGGRPETAVFWKSFLLFTRQLRFAAVLLLGGVFGGAYLLLLLTGGTSQEAGAVVAGMAVMMAGVTLLIGPMATRNDLRTDLQHVEMLRTLPLPGAGLVGAEVAASALTLTLVETAFLAVGLYFMVVGELVLGPLWAPWAVAAGAAFLMAPLNALSMCGQNGLALLLPAWVHLGPEKAEGIEHLGGDLLNGVASVVFLAAALLVPVAVAGMLGVRFYAALGWWTLLPAGLAAWALLWVEVVVLIALLGEHYDQMDVVDAGLLA